MDSVVPRPMVPPYAGLRLPRQPSRATASLLLGAAGIVALVAFVDDQVAAVYAPLFPLAGSLGIALGIVGVKPVRRGAWASIALGLFMFFVGNLLSATEGAAAPAFPAIANLAYVAGYPLLFAGAIRFARGSRGGDGSLYVDGAIIGIAGALLLWMALIDATGQLHLLPEAARALVFANVLLVALLLPLPLVRESRSPSGVLLVAGFVLLALADGRFGPELYGGAAAEVPRLLDLAGHAGWLAAFVLIGAAGLHPSARLLGTRAGNLAAERDPLRTVAVSLAILVAPIVFLLQAAGRPLQNPLVVAIAALVLALLVIFRIRRAIVDLVQADLRFRRFMNGNGMVALIKDRDGRHSYMNDRAIELAGFRDREWRGRTDVELFSPDVAEAYRRSDAKILKTGTYRSISDFAGRTWHTEKFQIPGDDGSIGLLQIDITERIEAEDALRQRESLLARAEAIAHVGSWEYDPEARTSRWSDEMYRIAGLDVGSPLDPGMTVAIIHPDDRDRATALVAEARRRNRPFDIECRLVRPTGEIRYVRVTGSVDVDTESRSVVVGAVHDVTERQAADERIRMLDAAMREATDAVIVTDREQRVVYVNPAFERVSGLRAREIIGRPRRERVGKSSSTFARALAQVVRHGRPWVGDIVDHHADGTTIVNATTISPLHGPNDEIAGHLTIKRDVTRERAEERASERRSRERALIAETLASLRAGRSPEETAAEICSQVAKVPEVAMVSVVAFGEDGVARVIGQVNRSDSAICGLTISPERSRYLRDRAAVGPWVERWIDDPQHPYGTMIRELGIQANAYAPLRTNGEPLGVLIVGSDDPEATAHLTERLSGFVEFAAIAGTLLAEPLEAHNAGARSERTIREAIEQRAFSIVFQPIVELRSGAIRGFEALSRFDDGRAPDAWFAEAHALGEVLGVELEAACLEGAMAASLQLPDDAWLNVNVSPALVMSGRLDALLPRTPRQLVLEVTEHAAITDYAAFRGAVMLLGDRVRLAVDDAGAGFASLRHIVELAPWLVKLDRSLIAGIDTDPARQAVVAGMVHFAATGSLVLVGEGIETEPELEILRSLGIELGQGYLLGRPEPAGDAPAAQAIRTGAGRAAS